MRAVNDWLEHKGLGRYAEKIVEVTDVTCLEDFKMIDAKMAEQIIETLQLKLFCSALLCEPFQSKAGSVGKPGMKLVTAEKFRQAVAEVIGARLEGAVAAPPPPPEEPLQEVIAICIDRSGRCATVCPLAGPKALASTTAGSMGTPFAEVTLNVVKGETRDSVAQRTRMEAVKAMFYAFRDRVESMGSGKYHLGLLQFDDKVERMLDTTPSLDLFESVVDDMKKRGQTAIYSSIVEANAVPRSFSVVQRVDDVATWARTVHQEEGFLRRATRMLEKYFSTDSKVSRYGPCSDHPIAVDLRILVLTDGQNNSGVSPEAAFEAVNNIGAVVDAIIVGNNPDSDLRRIVTATDGQCYQIGHLGEGFELLESEAVVSLKARRGGLEKPPYQPREERLAQQKVVSLASVETEALKKESHLSSGALRRILMELKRLNEGAPPGIHVFPTEDVSFWRVLMEGPPQSPFEGGIFALDVLLPNEYPFQPPKITFQTPIYHCNVNANGGICLDILKESWSPNLTVQQCLTSIRALLAEPNPEDALRQWIAELTLAYKPLGF
ncbi:Ubiquitin-conjugating enzyme E2 11 (E2 ubiquitin-conjugating enzyme 11) (Ubiquitin carrier protein 11) (Ubiquitin-conjugating enzyme E2-17 kDa 11) (Ubiquitin-protein ligase 11) [Durusdinium trenchii]|uniref:Ubiquitin-conjugating enzyme E2 11 (E2 ubiquitin-conjugating enzyme 11) (Ubiquitin carrier protein 11) (Ubiquitin-conjugating enzyme E2-17 kDa 11) (Ubiquitin-protein ligase 11) n=1 Tax=Durusdinium trenchii TaxID=1381693 RepID=A0ABP0LMR3_9DINO